MSLTGGILRKLQRISPSGCQSFRSACRLVYDEFGTPSQVIRMEEFETPDVTSTKDVVVRVLASPIHPSHINTIQGTYAIKPETFPATGGGEGVGQVIATGSDVTKFKVGDLVYPWANGTWTTHLKGKEHKFDLVFYQNMPVPEASILRTNPGSAYRMLRDFVDLRPGDVIIQSGANSAVGIAAIQIAKEMGLVSINIIRDRPDVGELKSHLQSLGATHVWTAEELRSTQVFREKIMPRPRLALDCVGGEVGTEMAKCLDNKGIHVTYGRMSPKPVAVPTTSLIFRDVQMKGFWMTRWVRENFGNNKMLAMFRDLEDMAVHGQLAFPHYTLVDIKDHKSVLEQVTKGFNNTKFIFDLKSAS